MKKGTGVFLLVCALVLILTVVVVKSYSSLSSLKENVNNREADINVQLNKKIAQSSKIVDATKEILKDEESIFNNIDSIIKREKESIEDKSKINNELTNELNILLEKIKGNEELYNNEDVKTLINDLLSTEKRIETAKYNYNDVVDDYNSKVNGFPSFIVAKVLGYKTRDEFKADKELINIYEEQEEL